MEHIQIAEKKLKRFVAFKKDLDAAMSVVQDNLLVVRHKIGRQVSTEGGTSKRDGGVLTHRAEEYLRCLDL